MELRDPTHLFEGEITDKQRKTAKIISAVTHAPLISIPVFILLNLTAGDPLKIVLYSLITVFVAAVAPIIIVRYYSKKFGNDDGDIVRREDRGLPLIAGTICYLIATVLLYVTGAPWISTVLMFCYTFNTAAVAVISTRWKISIHAIGMMGPSMALGLTYPPYGYLLLILLPFVMWARYVLRKHTPAQLVGGACLGVILTGIFFLLLL